MQFLYFPGIVISCSRFLSHVVINIPWLVPWMGDMLSSWRNLIWESLFFCLQFLCPKENGMQFVAQCALPKHFFRRYQGPCHYGLYLTKLFYSWRVFIFFAIVGSRLNWAEVEFLLFFIWPFLANSEKRTNRWRFYIDKSLMTRNMQPKHFRSGFNQARGNSEADSLIVHWIPCILNAWTNCMRCLSIPGWSRDKHVQ